MWNRTVQSRGNRGGVGLPASNLEKGVCSQQPINWKLWSQPASSGHPGFSPGRRGETTPATGCADHHKGWCGCARVQKRSWSFQGIAVLWRLTCMSRLCTMVYSLNSVDNWNIVCMLGDALCEPKTVTQQMLDWGKSKAQLQNKTHF